MRRVSHSSCDEGSLSARHSCRRCDAPMDSCRESETCERGPGDRPGTFWPKGSLAPSMRAARAGARVCALSAHWACCTVPTPEPRVAPGPRHPDAQPGACPPAPPAARLATHSSSGPRHGAQPSGGGPGGRLLSPASRRRRGRRRRRRLQQRAARCALQRLLQRAVGLGGAAGRHFRVSGGFAGRGAGAGAPHACERAAASM